MYSLLFVLSTLGLAILIENLAMAVYAVSFWHYYLYWLAYRFGTISLSTFKCDAIFMKTITLIGLGWAYAASPTDIASLTVVFSGFLLNTLAARALGSDRTYYGYEVAGLSHEQITTFPYSWVPHPMLIGNIAAFGGTMINNDFREKWWPLASAHVLLNIGLLIMETVVVPARRSEGSQRVWWFVFGAIGLGIGLGFWIADRSSALVGGALGALVFTYAVLIFRCYSAPASNLCKRREMPFSNTL